MSATDQAKVFVSSILNTSVEDLLEERKTVRQVVDSYRFLRSWAFEKAPASFEELDESYLRNVEECDIFIVIVGGEGSEPVAAEVQRAKQKNKPILVFAKSTSNRKPMAQMILETAGCKYASFQTVTDLEQAVRDALDHALALGLRSLSMSGRTLMSQLRELDDKKIHFRIQPMVPSFPGEYRFHIEGLDQKTVTVKLHATRESISLPVLRVSEILNFGDREAPILLLDGRLQWLTTIQRWRFFPEDVGTGTPLGLHKPSRLDDKRAIELTDYFRKREFQPGWAYEGDAPSKINAAYQPVYDDDGRYFRIPDRPDNLVLIVQRPSYPTLQA
ncbi:MAG: DUF4062 domain-containing protein [Candidatus Acidiferrum sp.]